MFKNLVARKPASEPVAAATESVDPNLDLETPVTESAILKSMDFSDLEEATSSLEAYVDGLTKRYATQDIFLASVEKFGADAGLLDYAVKTGVFSATSLETGATESLIGEDPEAALESMLTAALEEEKEEAGEVATKGSGALQNAIDKIKELTAKIVAKARAAGGKVKETVKAHPYASAAAAVALVATAAVVISKCTGKLTPSSIKGAEDMGSWKDAILKPLHDFKAGMGEKIAVTVKDAAGKTVKESTTRATYANGSKASAAGEWTVKKLDAIVEGLSSASSKLVSALQSFGAAAKRFAMQVKAGVFHPQKAMSVGVQATVSGKMSLLRLGTLSATVGVIYGAVLGLITRVISVGIVHVAKTVEAVADEEGEDKKPAGEGEPAAA